MKLAEIKNGKVSNTIIADSVIDGYVECPDSVGIGFDYDGENFTDNRPIPEPLRKTIYSKFTFKGKFTLNEWTACKNSSDTVVQDFIETFTIADYIDIEHEDLINAIQYLESVDLLDAGRASEILA
jgi:hypothetical protein